MTAARGQALVPYDVFLRGEAEGEDKHEWVNGVVYAMTRGSPEHGRLTNRVVLRILGPFVDDGCESFSSDTPIFIEAAQHHTYADASLVCGPLVTRTVHDKNGKKIGEAIVNPVLIVEVLSDATERYDRDGKFVAYSKLQSLREYVLVEQHERIVEVRALENGAWVTRVARGGESVVIHGRELAIDALYG